MKILTTSILLFFTTIIFSQTEDIVWQISYGGLGNDSLHTIVACPDGGFIVSGTSASGITGNKTTELFGLSDYWVIKFNADAEVEWQKSYGGELNDFLYAICPAIDGGYIIGGASNSGISGNKTIDTIQKSDYWILKVDDDGEIIWQAGYGGTDHDILKDIQPYGNDGYILGGLSRSDNSGVKSENSLGYSDYWLVRIDLYGNLIWENTIGGNDEDDFTTLLITSDSTIVAGGYSNSNISGDKDEYSSYDNDDVWIIALDSLGETVWQNTIAGNKYEYLYDLYEMENGNIQLIAHSRSDSSGDKTIDAIDDNHDYWIILIDSVGNVLEDTIYGGTYEDKIRAGLFIDENLFAYGGFSRSNAGYDKSHDSFGNYDYWIIGVDTFGNKVWDFTYGGDLDDYFMNMIVADDGGIIFGGYTKSGISGNKTVASNGLNDYWIIKIDPCSDSVVYYLDADADGYGNIDSTLLGLYCEIPEGYSINSMDCNDSDSTIFPGAVEVCNDIDDNCDGLIDESLTLWTLYLDADNDGYGNSLISIEYCGAVDGYVFNSWDCDDSDSTIHDLQKYYLDNDGDGIGNSATGEWICANEAPEGYSAVNNDCDDDNNLISDPQLYYADADGDGYGDPAVFEYICELMPEGFVTNRDDCNDNNAEINPDAIEIFNLQDDDCDGLYDEGVSAIENNAVFYFQLFPNPTDAFIIINCNSPSQKQIIIRNFFGEIVFQTTSTQTKINIDLKNYSSGIYFIELQTAGNILQKSFVKN